MTPPTPITDPTTRPDVTRILLSARASQHLSETGTACFALVARDTWPGDRNRWVILLKPCPLALARQAEGVALGSPRQPASKPLLCPPVTRETARQRQPCRDGFRSSGLLASAPCRVRN
jgi:hypothetical protein